MAASDLAEEFDAISAVGVLKPLSGWFCYLRRRRQVLFYGSEASPSADWLGPMAVV
ncbi:hypothetical protein A2U01_0074348, partial [Trifolium medium]|nr:hypothetical protein [Trifolium medium]